MARLEYEPRLEVYDKLLKYALKNCEAFMLVLCNYYKDPLYQELKSYNLKRSWSLW